MSKPETVADEGTAGSRPRDPATEDLGLGVTLRGFTEGHKVFDRYILRRVLGRGGMGVVWLAHDDALDRDVAIKFLPELVTLDREAIFELKRETRRSLELTHPHIVRIYDFEQDDQTAGITMEFIDGKTLSAIKIEQPGRCLGVTQIIPWIEQLCQALDYAHHKARVVHRDLKPANLMVDAEGDLKVSDFGISCSISDSVSRVSLARGSSGTPVYMSPQQSLGDKPTVQDDIYALGASIYDLLTGKPPFHSGDVLTQLREIVPPPMAQRREDLGNRAEPIPRAWEDLVAACLSKESARRPASAAEVGERLGLAVHATTRGRAPAAKAASPPSPPPAQGPFRHAIAMAGIFLAITAVGILLFASHQRRQSQLREEIARRNAENAARLTAQTPIAPPKPETQQPGSPPPTPPAQTPKSTAAAPTPVPQPPKTTPAQPPPKPTPAPPPKPKLPSPDQDSMATLATLVRFAKDPETPNRETLRPRIDRVISSYRAAQESVKPADVIRWRDALEGAAELGSVPAQALLSEGLNDQDPAAACKWGLKAAEGGDTRAMLETGRRYRDGKGTQPDSANARRWLSAAAATGDMESRNVLAYALLHGVGMPPDPPLAVAMYKELAAAGDAQALDLLGTFHHKGLHGLKADPAEAFRLYSQAAEKNNFEAVANLGVLYIKGEGTAKDPAKAAALFRRGAEAGNPRCMEFLAICLDDGIGLPKDTAAASEWRRKAETAAKKD